MSRYLSRFFWVNELRRWREIRANRRELERLSARYFECPHDGDYLCAKYGCPDDPNWKGDRR